MDKINDANQQKGNMIAILVSVIILAIIVVLYFLM